MRETGRRVIGGMPRPPRERWPVVAGILLTALLFAFVLVTSRAPLFLTRATSNPATPRERVVYLAPPEAASPELPAPVSASPPGAQRTQPAPIAPSAATPAPPSTTGRVPQGRPGAGGREGAPDSALIAPAEVPSRIPPPRTAIAGYGRDTVLTPGDCAGPCLAALQAAVGERDRPLTRAERDSILRVIGRTVAERARRSPAPPSPMARDSMARERALASLAGNEHRSRPLGVSIQTGLPGGGPTAEERRLAARLTAEYRARLDSIRLAAERRCGRLARRDTLPSDSLLVLACARLDPDTLTVSGPARPIGQSR